MKYFSVTVVLFMLSVISAAAQLPYSEDQFRAFDAKGSPVTMADIVKAAGDADVVFLGEQHDDPVGHAIEAEVFRRVYAEYGTKRKVTLSMEMFERDVQIVLNEYLGSLITEKHFLDASRPWGNYKTDYRPLVEFAKDKRLEVVAANAPRRYVNMVSRGGREALDALSKQAKEWLPHLPYAEASPAYAAKFKALMGPSPEAQMGIDKILSSQSLWDASMADAVTKALKRDNRSLVVHLNGGFHTESRLGTVEHLLKYRPKARVVVVTMLSVDDFKAFDKAKQTDLGDFVILTDGKLPRSKR
ncbi:MAG: ChaN family lipoprotein [Acidobacteriota bacterium]